MVLLAFVVMLVEFQKLVSTRRRGLNAMRRITLQTEEMKKANATWEWRHLPVMCDALPPSVTAPQADAGA